MCFCRQSNLQKQWQHGGGKKREFCRHFNLGRHVRVPSAHAINTWVQNFEETGAALKKKPSGDVQAVRTPDTVLLRFRDRAGGKVGEACVDYWRKFGVMRSKLKTLTPHIHSSPAFLIWLSREKLLLCALREHFFFCCSCFWLSLLNFLLLLFILLLSLFILVIIIVIVVFVF